MIDNHALILVEEAVEAGDARRVRTLQAIELRQAESELRVGRARTLSAARRRARPSAALEAFLRIASRLGSFWGGVRRPARADECFGDAWPSG